MPSAVDDPGPYDDDDDPDGIQLAAAAAAAGRDAGVEISAQRKIQ